SGHAEQWRTECARIRACVDEQCWSEEVQSYTFYPGTNELDASLLLAVRVAYLPPEDPKAPCNRRRDSRRPRRRRTVALSIQ
ncbi:MAG: hypothetical protein LC777_16910, partial [Actinobacteria bacterium]|nr:hypothetical protein [Actinomycetota bacterium]